MNCLFCSSELCNLYIRCSECNKNLCLDCFRIFSVGHGHSPEHSYTIVNNYLTNTSWSLEEEMTLIESINRYGYGNWNMISQSLKNKTCDECERHYEDTYLNDNWNLGFPKSECQMKYYPIHKRRKIDNKLLISSLYNFGQNIDYMPYINEFSKEFDDDIEKVVSLGNAKIVSDSSDMFGDEDFKSIIHPLLLIYKRRLIRRNSIKNFIRQFNLIEIIKFKTKEYKPTEFEKDIRKKMSVFYRMFSPLDFDCLVSSLNDQNKLSTLSLNDISAINRSSWNMGNGFDKFKSYIMENNTKNLKESCLDWLSIFYFNHPRIKIPEPVTCAFQESKKTKKIRKETGKLDLTTLPGVSLLNNNEKELCSELRLLPEVFLQVKNSFMKESTKHNGCLSLKIARTLARIDVNKTRKMFNFFIEQKLIKNM